MMASYARPRKGRLLLVIWLLPKPYAEQLGGLWCVVRVHPSLVSACWPFTKEEDVVFYEANPKKFVHLCARHLVGSLLGDPRFHRVEKRCQKYLHVVC